MKNYISGEMGLIKNHSVSESGITEKSYIISSGAGWMKIFFSSVELLFCRSFSFSQLQVMQKKLERVVRKTCGNALYE